MATRIQEIDVLRSIAIIFIIFAHIDSFTNSPLLDKLNTIFAFFGLSIFFFISGFLMQLKNKNNNFDSRKGIFSFFKKRATKVYPMYWISIATIYVMNIAGFNILYSNDIATDKFRLVSNILGLQGLLSNSLSIWWFVGVILLYYFLFPIIMHYSKNVRDLLVYSFVVVLPFLFMRNELHLVHVNMFNYYLIFIVGILSANAESLESLRKITLYYSVLLSIFYLMSYFGVNTNGLVDISKREIIFLIFTFIFTVYKIEYPCQSKFKLPEFVKQLADSSYSTYLFHIPLLTLFQSFINLLISLEIFSPFSSDYLIIFFGIPLTLFIGYLITMYFDKFCKKISQITPDAFKIFRSSF